MRFKKTNKNITANREVWSKYWDKKFEERKKQFNRK